MAASANLVVLMGNLTRDPEVRHTPGGRAVTTLSIAVNRYYIDRDSGKRVESTDFLDISVWGKMAENCARYLSKGRPVYIEGRLSVRKWETPNGEPRCKTEVVAQNVQFLGGSPSATRTEERDAEDVTSEEPEESEVKDEDEEIPF